MSRVDELLTIGVFNRTESEFFDALVAEGVDLFVDIRQRRGVRGAKYAFVNSTRLQHRLDELGIEYLYVKELAPTTEVRDAQKLADARLGVGKRKRVALGSAFIDAYRNDILGPLSRDEVTAQVPAAARRPVLFCVEARPDACHRSLAAEWLASAWGASVREVRR